MISSPHPVRYQPAGIICPNTFNSHKMPRKTRSQTQPASSSTNPPASDSKTPRRPEKEKAIEPNEIDAVQMNNHQTQLEEAIGMMSQEIGTIKELLERLFVPQALMKTRGNNAVEEWRTEQQATKTTTRGKVASGHRTNFQLVPQSRAESAQSAIPNSKKTNTKAGPSKPQNGMVSGLPPRSVAPPRS